MTPSEPKNAGELTAADVGPSIAAQAHLPSERERMADAFREWVHESPLSQCSMGADECPDWPLAYELADVALGVRRPSFSGEEGTEG